MFNLSSMPQSFPRLYLAGGALAFEEGRMGVDQILCVKRSAAGASGMPAVRRDLPGAR